jgi:hypothetical protein
MYVYFYKEDTWIWVSEAPYPEPPFNSSFEIYKMFMFMSVSKNLDRV